MSTPGDLPRSRIYPSLWGGAWGGEGVPGWVEDDFRAYLRCGILACSFARVPCDACAAERIVAF